jgi:hypothetical protein
LNLGIVTMTFYAVFPIVFGLFAGMVLCLEIGYRVGRRRMQRDGKTDEGLGSIETATFAMLGLLLGFAFSQALGRFDARRDMIVREANAIGTAYLRLDLAPMGDQPELRRLFRDYLDARIRAYSTPTDDEATDRSLAAAEGVQRRLWSAAASSANHDPSQNVARAIVPAINDMIDITTVRTVALNTKLPRAILVLLVTAALCSAMTAGYAMSRRGRRSILHVILYATSIAMTIYVVLDLEHPRRGLIRLDETDRIMEQLRESIR